MAFVQEIWYYKRNGIVSQSALISGREECVWGHSRRPRVIKRDTPIAILFLSAFAANRRIPGAEKSSSIRVRSVRYLNPWGPRLSFSLPLSQSGICKSTEHTSTMNCLSWDEQFYIYSASAHDSLAGRRALVQRGGLDGARAVDRGAWHHWQLLRHRSDAARLGADLAARQATVSNPRRLRSGRARRTLCALVPATWYTLLLLRRPVLLLFRALPLVCFWFNSMVSHSPNPQHPNRNIALCLHFRMVCKAIRALYQPVVVLIGFLLIGFNIERLVSFLWPLRSIHWLGTSTFCWIRFLLAGVPTMFMLTSTVLVSSFSRKFLFSIHLIFPSPIFPDRDVHTDARPKGQSRAASNKYFGQPVAKSKVP